jgi:hypothetical protein
MSEERAPYHPHRSSDRKIIARGGELVIFGVLPSALGNKLMEEFFLTRERAKELASEALRRRKKRGRLATKPLDGPG